MGEEVENTSIRFHSQGRGPMEVYLHHHLGREGHEAESPRLGLLTYAEVQRLARRASSAWEWRGLIKVKAGGATRFPGLGAAAFGPLSAWLEQLDDRWLELSWEAVRAIRLDVSPG